MKSSLNKYLFLLLLILPILGNAAIQTWKIIPAKSTLSFTAVQNGSPVTGKFASFNGTVSFDPKDLKQGGFNIAVDMGSVTNSYKELTDTLKTPDWFSVKIFPQAVFKSSGFTKTGDKTFRSTGTLTIRDKTQPIAITFTEEKRDASDYSIRGGTTLKRTLFGVGQGEWSDTKTVKDEVQVNFVVIAKQ